MDVDYVLLDLDGVVRHYDPDKLVRAATDHDLAPQVLIQAIREPATMGQLVTGAITRREWVQRIGEMVGNAEAVAQWSDDRGRISRAMMDLVDELWAAGLTVGVLTNGSSTVETELMQLGVLHRFDRVFNSAALGVAKPHRKIYDVVTQQLMLEPERIFFTDDVASNVDVALEVGWRAFLFESVDKLRADLVALGFTS